VTFEEGMTVIPANILKSNFGKGYVTTVNIPSTVVTIGQGAFAKQESLKKVNFAGDKLTTIDNSAFYDTGIEEIELADDVKSIGDEAFAYCSKLKSLVLPEDLVTIGWAAFRGCSNLKSVTIPSNVKNADSDIFSDCTALSTVTFEEGMTVIPANILKSNFGKGYVTTVNIPSTVVTIGQSAFAKQESLKKVNFAGDKLTTIEDSAFYDTGIEEIEIADGVTSIGSEAFYYCSSLKSLDLPENLKTLGWAAFRGCSSLKSVVIPKKLEDADSDIFSDCTSLTTVTFAEGMETIPNNILRASFGTSYVTTLFLPASVKAVGRNAFSKNNSLKTVYYRGTEATKNNISIEDGNNALSKAEWKYISKSVTGLTIDTTSKTAYTSELTTDESKVFTVKATINPADADITTVNVSKNNISGKAVESVKVASKNGNVTSFEVKLTGKEGESRITFTSEDGGFTATCNVVISDKETEQWGDVPAELRALFGNSPANVPQGVWYAFNEDNKPVYFTKSGKTDIKKAYTGSAIELSKIYVFDGKTLKVNGTDYTVTYKNNIKAAKADDANAPTVVISGIGEGASFTFTITPASSGLSGKMKSVKLAGFKTSVNYTGSQLTMTDLFNANDKTCKREGWTGVTLYVVDKKTKAKKALIEDVDYKVTIGDRVNVGKVKVTFTGIGGFTGSVSKNVTIKALKAAKDFKITVADATYTKAGVKPAVTVTYAGRTLVAGTDYTVTYSRNKKAALATDKSAPYVTVKAKGNYSGTSNKVTFTIKKADVSSLKMTAKDVKFKAKGSKGYFLAKPVFTDNGKKVTNGKNKDIKTVYTYTYNEDTTLQDGTVKKAGTEVDPKDKLSGATTIKVTAKVEPGSEKSSYTGATEMSVVYKVVKK
jgi:hypothetical protein